MMPTPAGMGAVGTFLPAQFAQGSTRTAMTKSVIPSRIRRTVNLWPGRHGGNASSG